MALFFNYLTKKIVRYKKLVLNAFMLLCLFFTFLFLYKELYQSLNNIATIHSLRSEADFAVLDQGLVDKVIDNIEEKTQTKKKSIINSPFD